MFFTAGDSAAEQELIRGSELRVLETLWGHIGLFGMDPHYRQQVDAALGQLLARPA
jgi:homoserine O-acetyltransferase